MTLDADFNLVPGKGGVKVHQYVTTHSDGHTLKPSWSFRTSLTCKSTKTLVNTLKNVSGFLKKDNLMTKIKS